MTDIDRAVTALLEARRLCTQVPVPALPDAEAAYAVQAGVADASGWFAGGPPRYWKSGGPSRSAVPTHAALPPAGVFQSPADLRSWPFHLRGIEAEIALRLGEPVDAGRAEALDLEGARKLVAAMCVSVEIVDSRWAQGLESPALAKLADLQSHGALVLGPWVPFAARDWSAQRCEVHIGARFAEVFVGTHAMADPAFVLPPWLRHATRRGAVVAAGTVVTTGTWCGIRHARAGEAVEVAFEGIGGAQVRL